MAEVLSSTRRGLLAMAAVAPVVMTAPMEVDDNRLAELKTLKAEAVAAWVAGDPTFDVAAERYEAAARAVLRQPSRTLVDLGVKAWIADFAPTGGDIGHLAATAAMTVVSEVRSLVGGRI